MAVENGVLDCFVFAADAVPYNYGPLGIFYFHSVFKRCNVSVPRTWDELIETCEGLKRCGMIPFTHAATHTVEQEMQWMAYLFLRQHGPDFYSHLLNGSIPYTDSRVSRTFETIQLFYDRGYFDYDSSWNPDYRPMYYGFTRGTKFGMGFNIYSWRGYEFDVYDPDDLDVFQFPIFDESIPIAEMQQIQSTFSSTNCKSPLLSDEFLRFTATPEFQLHSYPTGRLLPANCNNCTTDSNPSS